VELLKVANCALEQLKKEASLAATNKKRYLQLLRRAFGGNAGLNNTFGTGSTFLERGPLVTKRELPKLYHGTDIGAAESIMKTQLNPGGHNDYGKGVYLTADKHFGLAFSGRAARAKGTEPALLRLKTPGEATTEKIKLPSAQDAYRIDPASPVAGDSAIVFPPRNPQLNKFRHFGTEKAPTATPQHHTLNADAQTTLLTQWLNPAVGAGRKFAPAEKLPSTKYTTIGKDVNRSNLTDLYLQRRSRYQMLRDRQLVSGRAWSVGGNVTNEGQHVIFPKPIPSKYLKRVKLTESEAAIAREKQL
jgi:hypothetical protein